MNRLEALFWKVAGWFCWHQWKAAPWPLWYEDWEHRGEYWCVHCGNWKFEASKKDRQLNVPWLQLYWMEKKDRPISFWWV
jgi:hypothetical protein